MSEDSSNARLRNTALLVYAIALTAFVIGREFMSGRESAVAELERRVDDLRRDSTDLATTLNVMSTQIKFVNAEQARQNTVTQDIRDALAEIREAIKTK